MKLTKKIYIDSCEDCKYVYWYLGTSPCCILKNKKLCWDNVPEEEEIPPWCPLEDADKKGLEFQKKTRKES